MADSRVRPRGLTLADHDDLARELDALDEALLDIRGRIRDGAGSTSMGYVVVGRIITAVQALRDVLARALLDAHGDTLALRAVYGNGKSSPTRRRTVI